MGEPLESRRDQTTELIDRLQDEYPDATISLEFNTRLELLVAVILSAQCTDERVNEVTDELFDKYTAPGDYATTPVEELADDLYGITYHNQKAGYLHNACTRIIEDYGGDVPDTMEALTGLPGVGRKTANVVLQHGHDVVEGIVVDTHVQRLSRRLGLTDAERPDDIEAELLELVPEQYWQQFTHLLISHGRAVCTAQRPECANCVVEDMCPSSWVDNDVDLASGDSWE